MTVEDVRARFFTKIDIVNTDEATRFAKNVLSMNTKIAAPPGSVDVRLVIDLYSADGTVTTYFASPFRLYFKDGAESAEIDGAFKDKFRMAD